MITWILLAHFIILGHNFTLEKTFEPPRKMTVDQLCEYIAEERGVPLDEIYEHNFRIQMLSGCHIILEYWEGQKRFEQTLEEYLQEIHKP